MSECNCGYGGFHEPMNPNCNLNQTPERDLVTDEDVRAAWTAWSDPGDDRWTPERYDQWLADHDERVRAEAWDESAQEHRKGMVTTEWHQWPTNPYRREA